MLGGIALVVFVAREPRKIRASEALAADPVVEPIGPAKPRSPAPPPRPVVPEVSAPWLDDIAVASVGAHGSVVYVNPKRCAEIGRDVCAFFRVHEEGHVVLHHGGPRYTKFVHGRELAEEEADCYAARYASAVEVKSAIEFFRRAENVDSGLGDHATGAVRATRIAACRAS